MGVNKVKDKMDDILCLVFLMLLVGLMYASVMNLHLIANILDVVFCVFVGVEYGYGVGR